MSTTKMEILDIARRVAPLAAIAACWLWETVIPARRPDSGQIRRNAVNIAVGLSNATLAAVAFGAVMTVLASWTSANQWGVLNLLTPPLYIRWPLVLLLLDSFTYLWHCANHRSDWLWRFHRAHHADRALTATTAVRFHAGEIALSALAKMSLIPLFGLHLEELAAYETLLAVFTAFHHANISVGRWDALLRWVIVSPDMHKLHHSINPRETNTNFATVLSLWDRLGGTFQRPDRPDSLKFGLEEVADPKTEGFVGIWRIPFLTGPRATDPRRV